MSTTRPRDGRARSRELEVGIPRGPQSMEVGCTINMRVIAIVVASREQAVRSRLRQLLENEADMRVIAEASDLDCTREHVQDCHPDAVALALNTRGLPALNALRKLLDGARGTRYVVMDVERNADWEALPDAIRLATFDTLPAGSRARGI